MSAAAEAFDQMLFSGELPPDADTNEVRAFGPPGCGKTSYAQRYLAQAAKLYGPKGVLALSHTRAAARTLVQRGLALPDEAVGTLHAVCLRALGKPRIAETILSQWNKRYPLWPINGKSTDPEQESFEGAGDRALRRVNSLRARLVPLAQWPDGLRAFWGCWKQWKADEKAMDFTDLIVNAVKTVPFAPGNPNAIICDEAQDFTPLQLLLLRRWGASCRVLLMLGDDDQALYGYAGADSRGMLQPELPASQVRTLEQSYRIPEAVQRYAVRQWTSRLTARMPKTFSPRTEPGCVRRLNCGGFDVAGLIRHIERDLAAGDSVMLLASANFALKNALAELRRRGLPFSNVYRSESSAWNPLAGAGHGCAARLHALLACRSATRTPEAHWQGWELRLWASWLEARGVLEHGGKERLLDTEREAWLDLDFVASRLVDGERESFLAHFSAGDAALADWWRLRVLPEHRRDTAYAAKVVAVHQAQALRTPPKLTVGTIHSVKGGQADVVYLLPDLTNRWRSDYVAGGTRRDALLRMFYVASTRAFKTLNLCQPWRRGSSIELGAGVQ